VSWKRGATIGAMGLVAAGILFAYAKRPGNDFMVYVGSGEAILQGQDIYEVPLPSPNTCPPFFSVFCVVPALLERVSPGFARGAWGLLNTASLLLTLGMASRLIHGRRQPILSSPLLVPLILTLPYILYHLLYHQVNLIVLVLTLGGMKMQEERKEWQGGLLVGLASALKVMPVLFVPYLFYRRRWVAAFAALAATLVFTLSPGLVMGWDRFGADFRHWYTMLPQNPCWGAGQRNQSVLAMWDRILGHGLIPFASPGVTYLPMSGAPIVRLAWLSTILVTGFLMLFSFRGKPQRGGLAAIAEWSAIFVVSAIFGPVGWKHYLVVLLLPNMLLFRVWRSDGDRRTRRLAGAVLCGSFLIGLSSTHNLFGTAWCMRVGMASNLTLAALFMLGGLLWLRHRIARREAGLGPVSDELSLTPLGRPEHAPAGIPAAGPFLRGAREGESR
jgi:alpha-1,2-mannosyltransferase